MHGPTAPLLGRRSRGLVHSRALATTTNHHRGGTLPDDGFVAFVLDQLEGAGRVSARLLRVPAEVVEDAEELREWAREAARAERSA